MKRHGRKFQLQLKKLYFHAFRSSDSARRVSMFSVHEFQEAACKLLPTSSLQNMNNVTSENCINELISGRILALWSLFLDAKCIEIFKPHKERITIPVAIGKNQLQKGLSLNLSKTFWCQSREIRHTHTHTHQRGGRPPTSASWRKKWGEWSQQT